MSAALYRLYDTAGELLYVGISLSAIQRLSEHMAAKPWARDIARVEVEWFPTRDEAAAAEIKAIKAEWPLHNVQHNQRGWFDVARKVEAQDMPDQCHDFCVVLNPEDSAIYFPYRWESGLAQYECRAGHQWTCHWGHRESGSDPAQRVQP